MRITALRCEQRSNALGIDARRPRLSWRLQEDEGDSSRRCLRQSAYRITAAQTPVQLASNHGLLWDSGRVISDQCVLIAYAGPEPASRQRVYWQIEAWDERGDSATGGPAWFEMGLLDQFVDWQGAEWIGSPLYGGKFTAAPAPYLRRSFVLADRPARARLYITALGFHDASINGQPVGADVLAPGSTDYYKRVQYQVYDVAELLQAGENVIGVILGDGWYCGHNQFLGRQTYGDVPKLLARLEIDAADGSSCLIASDRAWKTSAGPILESDMLMGESYDARRELGDWCLPGYDDSGWLPARMFPDALGAAKIVAMPGPPVRRQEERRPVSAPVKVGGRWIFDFGQNIVGWARLKVRGTAGTTVTLRFAEMLKPSGELYTESLRAARQTDRYTLKGHGDEIYEPRFTFHGFRYVEITGYPGEPDESAVTGIVVHSDMERTGAFECSDPLVNQLQSNIEWGLRGNFVDIPTDCPQRDERLGWTGDAQVFIGTAAFLRDVSGFFTKWLRDLRDAQDEAGHVPAVVPYVSNVPVDGGPAWADAAVICPWTAYLAYGDAGILAENYESMRAFVDAMLREAPDLIRCNPERGGWGGFGDWLSTKAETPPELIGTAFFAYSARLLSMAAEVLGDADAGARYADLSQRIKAAFAKRFITQAGLVTGQSQTAYALALSFDLIPASLRGAAADALERDIRARGMHLSTGFVGTPYLLHALASEGRDEIAYALLRQTTFPGWLYPVTQGATTIWERWDGWTVDKGFQDAAMNSFNHYAYGAVGEWLYRCVAGISSDVSPEGAGYRRIVLQPRPGGGITHARASHRSPYGEIVSAWRVRNDGSLEWEAVVPPNTSASATLSATSAAAITESGKPLSDAAGVGSITEDDHMRRVTFTLGSGRYRFHVKTTPG